MCGGGRTWACWAAHKHRGAARPDKGRQLGLGNLTGHILHRWRRPFLATKRGTPARRPSGHSRGGCRAAQRAGAAPHASARRRAARLGAAAACSMRSATAAQARTTSGPGRGSAMRSPGRWARAALAWPAPTAGERARAGPPFLARQRAARPRLGAGAARRRAAPAKQATARPLGRGSTGAWPRRGNPLRRRAVPRPAAARTYGHGTARRCGPGDTRDLPSVVGPS